MNRPADQGKQGGFTLIELMTAMAILVVIVMFMSRIVTESTQVWNSGMRRTEVHNTGRAIMDFMVRDLSSAVADDVLQFQVESLEYSLYGFPAGDTINFVTLAQMPDADRREAMEIMYYVRDADANGYELMRVRRNRRNSVSAYEGPGWVGDKRGASLMAMNVAAFRTEVYFFDGDTLDSKLDSDYDTMAGDSPPLWVDIYIELLSEADVAQAGDLADAADFLNRTAHRFTGRAYFHNAAGYNRPGEYYPFYEPYNAEYEQ